MSYTNLMQQIIQSPRVSLQANEERVERYTNLLQTPVAFTNSMILTTSRFSPQESHQHDRLYEEQISTEHWSYEEFDRLYNNSNMVTWTEGGPEKSIEELYESKNIHFKRKRDDTNITNEGNDDPNIGEIDDLQLLNSGNEAEEIHNGEIYD